MGYTHGTYWTDELIKEKICEVINNLGIDRMPSRKECNLEKQLSTCDFYILITISREEENRVMVVPSSKVIANNQISVGAGKSKYHKFTDRFDLIEKAVEFWQNLPA